LLGLSLTAFDAKRTSIFQVKTDHSSVAARQAHVQSTLSNAIAPSLLRWRGVPSRRTTFYGIGVRTEARLAAELRRTGNNVRHVSAAYHRKTDLLVP
jgi:hypothetical protein